MVTESPAGRIQRGHPYTEAVGAIDWTRELGNGQPPARGDR